MTTPKEIALLKSDFIIVANRLPVSVTKKDGVLHFSPSTGGLATAMSSIKQDDGKLWIGWPGIASDNLTPADKRTITRKLREHNCIPVFLTQEQISSYYDGYSNSVIWPLFHYFQHLVTYNQTYWQTYQSVNHSFQHAVLRHANVKATIWVHDYHLMLLPALLRPALPGGAIGFFLHIPFPSYEIFRVLPNCAEILNGILGADLVGFHTYDYTRHFISSARRVLGYENKFGSIAVGNRSVKTDAFPIGVDYDKFATTATSLPVKKLVADLKKRFKKQQIIVSVDRLDYTKGIVERLEAFGTFLEQFPAFQGKVALIMIAVPSRTEILAYQQLRDTIERTVSRINGTYSTAHWSPISYQYSSLPFEQIVAMYAAADVALVTPLRDGMNLVSKEYIASKQSDTGVLILSEMAGAASELPEALRVNPYDTAAIVLAIKQALTMSIDKQNKALKAMQARIARYSIARWACDFVDQLDHTRKNTELTEARQLSTLAQQNIRSNYNSAQNRIFLLDYDGTLRHFVPSPEFEAARPSEELLATLAALSADPKNTICIISGRTKEALASWFGDMPITLIAEHGAWVRDGDWNKIDIDFRPHKAKILPILERYAERTPGAIVEEKDFALVWHYRNVIQELAHTRNSDLRHELSSALQKTEVALFEGNKIIEIKPESVHKGVVVAKLLADRQADFVFCAGDDYTDEDMFDALPEAAWTIKVGLSGTRARYRVSSVDDVIAQLKSFVE